ncbi:phage major capsid protein [Allosphingosinicella indica]|uniref:Phage major capsid protein, HK97 family n=1 Tax=Allosphingosinicella indica TaxID=941907 RepID=A0A1X7GJ62_9SPHN|nr:phage major capsid protein [Allosphingosinicella indica]SMF70551.1 phage major capsid protein, HK97 family [Allosphingosinicella indica]
MKHMVGASALALAAADLRPEYGRKDAAGNDVVELDGRDLAKLTEEVKSALGQVQDFGVKAAEALRKGEELSAASKKEIDEALTKLNTIEELKKRFDAMEQKAARGGGEPQGPRSAGHRVIESDAFKSFAENRSGPGKVVIDVKDISSLTTDAAGSVGTLVQPTRVAAPIMLPQRRMTIRSLLAQGRTASNLVEFDREKMFTNNAAMVAEGAAKPQSELQFEEASAPVRKIAHWFRMSAEILADAPALRSVVDNRLRYGLAFREEVQLLNGSGSGQNISGLVTNATAYSAPSGLSPDTLVDTIRLAILQVALAEYPANGIVLNPIDWAVIELLKDDLGRYLIGNPQGTITPTLWGLPVIATTAMTEDKFLVGAFDLAAQIFDREDASIMLSTEDQDNFIKNKVTIMAEERLALAIYRTQSLVYGDLGRVT